MARKRIAVVYPNVLEIELQPDSSTDRQRGANKFKLLEILVY